MCQNGFYGRGRYSEGFGMGRTDLIRLLIKFRMTHAGMASGMSKQAAAAIAEEKAQQVKNPIKAMGTPDGAIVVMVENYLAHVGPIAGGIFNFENPPDSPEFSMASRKAIKEIEARRNKMWRGEGPVPDKFTEYVYYRTRIEVQKQFGITPDEMGLDRQTVSEMIKICIAALAPKYAEKQPQKSGCFVATACFGSPDHPVVTTLRDFRDRRLTRTALGRGFIRWYYANGPALASWIASKPAARLMVRSLLRIVVRIIRPVVGRP